MSYWYQHIIDALKAEQVTFKLPVDSLFAGVYLPQHQLAVHFISIQPDILTNLPSDYFVSLNKQAPAIKFIHIWEDVYTRHPDLVLARLLVLIGQRKRIHGRATTVKRIHKAEADLFLNHHHLQGCASAYYKFGLYHRQILVAVATFSKSRVMHDEVVPYRSYELVRFASKTGYTITGGLSKLLQAFINEVRPAHIMTYADNDWGNGNGYLKLGFKPTAQHNPDAFYINTETLQRYSFNQVQRLDIPAQNLITVFNSGSSKFTLSLADYIS